MTALRPRSLDEMPVTAFSVEPTLSIQTGAWKYVRPRYEDVLPPCSAACPAGNDISQALLLAAQGRFAEAARLLRAGNPFPSTLGRVCPHPCERSCNRDPLGGCVWVHSIERFIGDHPLELEKVLARAPRTGRCLAVIGAGPAGITAAYVLALAGHDVEVFDNQTRPGGYLRTGIPEYRLPKQILDREIELVARAGVRFTPETRIGTDVSLDELQRGFHAVVLAVGLHRPRPLDVPGIDHPAVFSGTELLNRILLGEHPAIPPVVAVVGGGNTAIDVARSVLRLGTKPIVVYRRTREEMPAVPSEVEEAEKEGVEFHFLCAPRRVVTDGNAIVSLECVTMRPGKTDASGRRKPVPVAGSEFLIPVQGIVSAIGETAEVGFLSEELRKGLGGAREGLIAKSLFVAGDVVTGSGTVAAAVGSGRRVAAAVDRYLQGLDTVSPYTLQQSWQRSVNTSRIADASRLNTAYIQAQPHPVARELRPEERRNSFAEVVQGFTEEDAVREARRCLSCGTCNDCMNCLYFCPDVAVHKRARGKGFDIDSDHCKGCGICVEECPRGALQLEGVAS